MAQNLAQDFVDLSNRRLGADSPTELHLNHGVYGFGIRPLVVMLHEGFPIKVVEMPHAMPQSVKSPSSLTGLCPTISSSPTIRQTARQLQATSKAKANNDDGGRVNEPPLLGGM